MWGFMNLDFNWIEHQYKIAVSLANQVMALADAFLFKNCQRYWAIEKSPVLLVARKLLVAKAKNIYWSTNKMHITMETGFNL